MKRINNLKNQLSQIEEKTTKERIVICAMSRTPFTVMNTQLKEVPLEILLKSTITNLKTKANIGLIEEVEEVLVGNVNNLGNISFPVKSALSLSFNQDSNSIKLSFNSNLFSCNLQNVITLINSIKSNYSSFGFIIGIESNSLFMKSIKSMKNTSHIVTLSQETVINDYSSKLIIPIAIEAEYLNKAFSIKKNEINEFANKSIEKGKKTMSSQVLHDHIDEIEIRRKEISKNEYNIDDSIYKVGVNYGFHHDLFKNSNDTKPLFIHQGVYNKSNIPFLSDGCGGVAISSYSNAINKNYPILVEIVDYIEYYNKANPYLSQADGIRVLLNKSKLSIEEIDCFEFNECLIGQVLITINTLKIDMNKVNILGGDIVYGNALGVCDLRLIMNGVSILKFYKKRYLLVSSTISLKKSVCMLIKNIEE